MYFILDNKKVYVIRYLKKILQAHLGSYLVLFLMKVVNIFEDTLENPIVKGKNIKEQFSNKKKCHIVINIVMFHK